MLQESNCAVWTCIMFSFSSIACSASGPFSIDSPPPVYYPLLIVSIQLQQTFFQEILLQDSQSLIFPVLQVIPQCVNLLLALRQFRVQAIPNTFQLIRGNTLSCCDIDKHIHAYNYIITRQL